MKRRTALAMALSVTCTLAGGLLGLPLPAGAAAALTATATVPHISNLVATSVAAGGGTWATLPMGRLDQPLNTFWQLLYQPAGGTKWANHVEATATATNGGLVLAPAGNTLLVGVRPSAHLAFTPLLRTSDGGRDWSDGLVGTRLAASQAALAAGGSGQLVALVGTKSGQRVLVNDNGNLYRWDRLTARSALARTKVGRECGLMALTAVAYFAGAPVVGGSCDHAGRAGIFEGRNGKWALLGDGLPSNLKGDGSQVLALHAVGGHMDALVAAKAGPRTSLVVVTAASGGKSTSSVPLALSPYEQLVALGRAGKGFFVLLRPLQGPDRLMVYGFPAHGGALGGPIGDKWQSLVRPPTGTSAVAVTGKRPTVYAMVAQGTALTIWVLPSGAHKWSKAQVLDVHLQYGSSS